MPDSDINEAKIKAEFIIKMMNQVEFNEIGRITVSIGYGAQILTVF